MSLLVEYTYIIDMVRPTRPPLTPRERCVMFMSAVVLALVPWSWGGVVQWTVAAALGISVATLVAAVGTLNQQRAAIVVWFLGIVVAFLALPPDLEPFSYGGAVYLAFPLAAFASQLIPAWVYATDARSRPASAGLQQLLATPVFWAGLVFIAYVLLQHFNAWGEVIDRTAFWKAQGAKLDLGPLVIEPRDHIAWLPSGLAAPFLSTDPAVPTMNALRLLMILGAPWLLFLALRCGLRRRRGYVALAWVSVLVASVVAIYGFFNQPSSGTILGFPVPPNVRTFGTFINRNHAAVYLYFNAALALALTFWHVRQCRHLSLRGGPYLVSAFFALFLGCFAVLTNSFGGLLVFVVLIGVAAPVGFFFGMPRSDLMKTETLVVTLTTLMVVALVFLLTADFRAVGNKVTRKTDMYQREGVSDRRPYRLATWELATEGGWTGRVWTGWGAGSYRWVSPPYQAKQKELVYPSGKLRFQALYAHFDWLQALAEVGIIGLLPIIAGLWWLAGWIRRSFLRGTPEAVPLACVLVLFGLHACFDLLFWFTPLLYMAALSAAAMISFVEQAAADAEIEEQIRSEKASAAKA